MTEEINKYIRTKKIQSLVLSLNAKELLEKEDYENYVEEDNFLPALHCFVNYCSEEEILDSNVKRNIYDLLQIVRFEIPFKDAFEKSKKYDQVNEIIKITNNGEDNASFYYYFKEYIKRLNLVVVPKNRHKHMLNFVEVGIDEIKKSISNDYLFLNGLTNSTYDDNFEDYIVPEMLASEEFMYSLYAMCAEKKELFVDEKIKTKTLFVLKNSLNLMRKKKSNYVLDENDVITIRKKMITRQLINKIK